MMVVGVVAASNKCAAYLQACLSSRPRPPSRDNTRTASQLCVATFSPWQCCWQV